MEEKDKKKGKYCGPKIDVCFMNYKDVLDVSDDRNNDNHDINIEDMDDWG